MGRWAPEAELRLRAAALELFGERGYDATTVADISERAGLTARTFFRYFADKREVLFGGSAGLEEQLVAAARGAAPGTEPLDVVTVALDELADLLGGDPTWSRRRQAAIDATPELRERELVKLATLASRLGDVLVERGVPARDATLAAEAGLAVFRVAFDAWTSDDGDLSLSDLVHDSLARLRGVVAAPGPRAVED